MRKIQFFFASLAMIACSSNDDAPVTEPVEENPEYPEECILTTGYSIKSQADVNLLASRNICKIEGDLFIGADFRSPASDINDLSGLSTIKEVTGELVIHSNNELQNLHGLENVRKVGALEIIDNSKLTSCEGLGVVEISGIIDSNNLVRGLLVLRNDALLNLKGLENLTSTASVKLSGNEAFKDITALAGLKNLPDLEIIESNALTNLEGFNNLTNIGNFRLEGNLSLNSLEAFESLTNLKFFSCGGNPMLLSLKGLENVVKMEALSISQSQFTSLDGIQNVMSLNYISLRSNKYLRSISQLSNTTSVINIDIRDNQSLESLQGLHNIKSCEHYINIQENNVLTSILGLSGLESVYEIAIIDCSALTSLEGLGALRQINNLKISNVPLNSIGNLGNIHSLSILEIFRTQITTLSGFGGLSNLKIFGVFNNSNLISLNGLENVTTLARLSVENCPNLVSIHALSNVNSFSEYFFEGVLYEGKISIINTGLTSLDALNNVTNSPANLVIENNSALGDFCGLHNLNTDILEYVSIVGNQYNPTAQDIIAGNCSQ